MKPTSTEHLHDRGTDRLLADLAKVKASATQPNWLRGEYNTPDMARERAQAMRASLLSPEADARDAAASKARVRAHIREKIGPTVAAIDAALGRPACPRCGEPMTELEPRKAEPDTGVQAFAGGMGCDGCGAEVEDEEARDDQDRREDDGRRWGPSIFIPTFCLALCGLLIPAQPTPINDSLPSSSGLHDAGRATNPAPNRDGWRGFLYST